MVTEGVSVVEKVVVIGAGYVGLVTAACFAKKGWSVTVVENNNSKVVKLLSGEIPFYEPGLSELVTTGIKNKTLCFVSTIEQALLCNPELIFSCVGTPSLPDGSVDMSYVWEVMRQIGTCLSSYSVIVNKSTVPVGTAQKAKQLLQKMFDERKVLFGFEVVSNPEFLREGNAVYDFLHPDRVVLGFAKIDEVGRAHKILSDFYASFVTSQEQMVCMNFESAELTKYAANTMLAMRISFINELAQLALKVGADIEQVAFGMGLDERIGPSFLKAGIGYGGSCFPKDVKALIDIGKKNGIPMSLATATEQVNNEQRLTFAHQIVAHYGGSLTGKTIGIWGVAFKPETDDVRSAPSIDIMKTLLSFGAKLIVYDPVALEAIANYRSEQVIFATSARQVLELSDVLVVATEWKEFLQIDMQAFTLLRDRTIFDGRNCFDMKKCSDFGIRYFCVGRSQNSYTGVTHQSELGKSATL